MFRETAVETSDFYCGQQEPRRFLYDNEWKTVTVIEDRWYEGYVEAKQVPQRYFRVKTSDGRCFMLRYNQLFDRWSVKELRI